MVSDVREVARRARSALVGAQFEIGLLGMRQPVSPIGHLLDGSVVAPLEELGGPCADRLAAGAPSPVLELWAWDLSDAPQPDRLRAKVYLQGRVRPITIAPGESGADRVDCACFDPGLVRLTVYGHGGADVQSWPVPIAEFRSAPLDPLAGWERGWLRHLDRDHRHDLRVLASRYTCLRAQDVVRPWRADRHGIVLRVYRQHEVCDVDVPFGPGVACGCGAKEALQNLLTNTPAPDHTPAQD